MADTAKPQCGGGNANLEAYDFPLHAAAIFIVFAASIAGSGFPVVAKKVKALKIPPKLFFGCKHFGTGVLIATAFVHLVPTAFASLSDPCLPSLLIDDYPAMPGVIMMAALFMLFTIEMYLKAKTGGHSHGGATGEGILNPQPFHSHQISAPKPVLERTQTSTSLPAYDKGVNPFADRYRFEEKEQYIARAYEMPDEKNEMDEFGVHSEMPTWFQVFYSQYVRQRDELRDMIAILARTASGAPPQAVASRGIEPAVERPDMVYGSDGEPPMTPAQFRLANLNITLLEGGILFHSIFVGMTISITTDGFVTLLVAILFHQFFEGLGLGSRIAAIPYPKGAWKPWILVVAFGTTCPIGQIIGLVTRDSYDPSSAFALILVGFFNAFSSGLLIYAATVDLLAEDFLSEEAAHTMSKKQKIVAFSLVLAGAAGMSVVGAFA